VRIRKVLGTGEATNAGYVQFGQPAERSEVLANDGFGRTLSLSGVRRDVNFRPLYRYAPASWMIRAASRIEVGEA
jgi:hypothetical protein